MTFGRFFFSFVARRSYSVTNMRLGMTTGRGSAGLLLFQGWPSNYPHASSIPWLRGPPPNSVRKLWSMPGLSFLTRRR